MTDLQTRFTAKRGMIVDSFLKIEEFSFQLKISNDRHDLDLEDIFRSFLPKKIVFKYKNIIDYSSVKQRRTWSTLKGE